MMKKFAKCMVGFLLIVSTIITLCGCGGSKHVYKVKYASGPVKQAGEKAVEIIDQYLAYDITKEEMAASLLEISGRIGDYTEYESLSPERNISFQIGIVANHANQHTDIEILEARDVIAVNCGLQETGEVFKKKDEADLEELGYFEELDEDREKYIKKYNINTDGISRFWSYKSESGEVIIEATFDYSYGYSPELLIKLMELLLPEVEDGKLSVNADIDYYEQDIARVSIGKSTSDGLYAAMAYWACEDENDRYEYIDFSSAADIDNLKNVVEEIEIKR